MLALDFAKYPTALNELLKNSLNKRTFNSLLRFSEVIQSLGYHVPICSQRSVMKLGELSDDRKIQIATYYENWSSWICSTEIDGTDSGSIAERERRCAEKALRHYGLHVSDEFWKTFDGEQYVQIYGEDMVQLYRSLNFFDVCGYSLLDLSVFEWYILWDRPTQIMKEMLNCAQEVLTEFVPVKKFRAPQHILRETYDTGISYEPFVPRAALVDFMYIASLTGTPSLHGTPRGFICTTSGRVIADGADAMDINFI